MFVERLVNQGSGPVLEQWLQFTAERQKVIAEDVVNLSTPNYEQKDLSVDKFQSMLNEQIEQRDSGGGGLGQSGEAAPSFEMSSPGMLYHDGARRSLEQLMTNQAKNGMTHNLIIELLKKQYSQLEMAIREHP